MGKGNGKTETRFDVEREDLEHELPVAEGGEKAASAAVAAKPAETDGAAPSETEKLQLERDALLDRLARLQAEFDNARKRAVREQQDFREFAAGDVIKNFLPILDSFERALKAEGDSSDFRNGIELIYRQFQDRSEEHTSELQSLRHLVCRLLLE